jgi:hypothetical protein
MMVEFKEMPYDEKYGSVLDYMKLLEDFVLPLVKEDLGDEKVAELKSIWQKESEPIPEGASHKEKYEAAYCNWLRNWASAFNFVSKHLGESGTEKFKHEDAEALKRKNASPALFILRLMRAISPQTAFRTFAKQMAYQLQVFTPFSISELTGHRMVANLPHCKVLDAQGCDDFCIVGCQKISPLWMKNQFNVKMTTERKGKSCTVTLTPI